MSSKTIIDEIVDFVEDHSILISVICGLVLTYLYFFTKQKIETFTGSEFPEVFNTNLKDSPKKLSNTASSNIVSSNKGATTNSDLDAPPKKVLKQEPPPSLDKDLNTLNSSKKDMKSYNLLENQTNLVGDIGSKDASLYHYRNNYGDVGTMFDTFFGQPESVTKDAIKSQPKESIYRELRFIMYYAPWCGWSKKTMPEFEKLKSNHNTMINGTQVKILKYDDKHHKTASAKIRGFPTIQIEKEKHDGTIETADYKGSRTSDSFLADIKRHLS